MGAPGVREDPGGSTGCRGVFWEEHPREIKTIHEDSRVEILYRAYEIIRCGWRPSSYLTRPRIF